MSAGDQQEKMNQAPAAAPRPWTWVAGLFLSLAAGLLTNECFSAWTGLSGSPAFRAFVAQWITLPLVVVSLIRLDFKRENGGCLGASAYFLIDHIFQLILLFLAVIIVWCLIGSAFWAQWIMLLVVGGILIWFYFIREHGQFFWPLVHFLHDHIFQSILLFLTFGIVWCLVGTIFGLPDLIWSESDNGRFLSALGATMVLALIGINAFYLDPHPDETKDKVEGFLRQYGADLGFGTWIEPEYPDSRNLSHFLRTVRLPFLTLLILPALFPLPFEFVPKQAPVWHPGSTAVEDHVAGTIGAYLWSLLVWCSGILFGVLLIKVCIRVGDKASELTDPVTQAFEVVAITIRAWAVGFGHFLSGNVRCVWVRVLAAWYCLVPDERHEAVEGGQNPGPGGGAPNAGAPGPDGNENRVYALSTFVFVFALVYAYVAAFFYTSVSPGLAIFALISLLAMAAALFHILIRDHRWRVGVPVLVLLWVAWANHQLYKLQFDNLSYDDGARIELARHDPRIGDAAPLGFVGPMETVKLEGEPDVDPGLVTNQQTLDYIYNHHVVPRVDSALPKPKLAVVCCSGGGTLAAFWSAKVLDWLDTAMKKEEGFRKSLRLVSASPAGSVGAFQYIRHLYDETYNPDGPPTTGKPRAGNGADRLDEVPRESLVPVAQSIALREIWRMFTPSEGALLRDRGEVLERDWKALRNLTLEELRDAERQCVIPSLVVAPVLLEDRRRLLISNLDLSRNALPEDDLRPVNRNLCVHRGYELIFPPIAHKLIKGKDGEAWRGLVSGTEQGLEYWPENRGRFDDPVFSMTAFEFSKLFPRERGFRLATAARMAATVPFISPAVYLPTRPALRVIDSGYRDNFAVDVAASWIFLNREWILAKTSGVVLIQIRALGDPEARLKIPERQDIWTWLLKGYQFFTSVPEGAAHAFSTSALLRNDQVVALLGKLLNEAIEKGGGKRGFFTTVIFELPATVRQIPDKNEWPKVPEGEDWRGWEASEGTISWSLSAAEARAVKERALPDSEFASRSGMNGKEERLKPLRKLQCALRDVSDPRERLALRWEYERALNYERLQSLKCWWRKNYAPEK